MILVDPNKPVYRGNTHTHTQNSDGRKSFDEALDIYAALGHDFLVVTDHWKIGPETRRGKMLVMSGIEYDFLDVPNQALHVVGILPGGADPGLDREKDNRDYNYAIRRINEVGGAAVLAHPHWSLNTLDVMKNVGDVVGAEVYNAVSGLPFGPDRAVSTAQLDVAAANGRLFRFLCGDDTHYYLSEPGSGFTMAQADECTPEGIIAALKRGSFYCTQGPLVHAASYDPEARVFSVDCSPADMVVFYTDAPWAPARCVAEKGMTHAEYHSVDRDHFVRCEVIDASGKRAWISPVKA